MCIRDREGEGEDGWRRGAAAAAALLVPLRRLQSRAAVEVVSSTGTSDATMSTRGDDSSSIALAETISTLSTTSMVGITSRTQPDDASLIGSSSLSSGITVSEAVLFHQRRMNQNPAASSPSSPASQQTPPVIGGLARQLGIAAVRSDARASFLAALGGGGAC